MTTFPSACELEHVIFSRKMWYPPRPVVSGGGELSNDRRMTRVDDQRSIVAIDPSSRGLAFAFFEGGLLLDWGTRRNDQDQIGVADRLVSTYQADVLVIEDPTARRCERRTRIRRLLRDVAAHMRSRGVVVLLVGRYEVRRSWAEIGKTTKHAVAEEIGRLFPEIEYLVPRKRRSFESEQARADIFDAISLVVHAFGIDADLAASAA